MSKDTLISGLTAFMEDAEVEKPGLDEEDKDTTGIDSEEKDSENNEGTVPTTPTDSYRLEAKETAARTPSQEYCPVFIEMKADGTKHLRSYIEGVVNDVDKYVNLIDLLMFGLNENDSATIYFDSQGGMVASGGLIASAIHHSKAHDNIITDARGLCASSAALMHSAAKPGNARVSAFATLMYHMSSHFDDGLSSKIAERAINQVRYVNECLLNKALDDGHITKEEFDRIQNGKEIFVSAAEFNQRIAAKNQKRDN